LCAAVSRFSNRLVASFYVEHNEVDNEIALLGLDIELATKPHCKIVEH
jgi:hypothetical protein